MLTIEVTGNIGMRSGRSRDGKTFSVREQEAYVRMGREVRKVALRVEEGGQPLAPGDYQVADASFGTDQYDNLVVKRIVLEPVVARLKSAG